MKSKEFDMIKILAWADFKSKYNRSILGFFWSLLKPFLMLSTLYIVFYYFLNIRINNYPIFLLLGIIIWNFFAEATSNSLKCLVAKESLIKKSVFSKKIIVLSSCISSFYTFLTSFFIFGIIFFATGLSISIHAIAFPILIIFLSIFIIGISYALSILYIKYRDLDHIWDVILQIGFWATPIIYGLNVVPEVYLKFYNLNPLARIINDSRDALIFHSLPSIKHMIITAICCILVYLIGFWIFEKAKRKIGDWM